MLVCNVDDVLHFFDFNVTFPPTTFFCRMCSWKKCEWLLNFFPLHLNKLILSFKMSVKYCTFNPHSSFNLTYIFFSIICLFIYGITYPKLNIHVIYLAKSQGILWPMLWPQTVPNFSLHLPWISGFLHYFLLPCTWQHQRNVIDFL